MIKIAALNEESDGSSGAEEEEVTREALEQIALDQYTKALELQRKGGDGVQSALRLLKDLLDTEVLYHVKKPEKGEKATDPLFNLKYLCYKNIASIHTSLGNKEEAIEAYCEAAALDNTDVSLWYRLGNLCLQCQKFDMALDAYQRGYECNSKHWPCIDKIITLLHGLGHYNDCIVAIVDALKLDPGYLRGLAYRKHIYTEYPYILEYMSYLNPEYGWKPEQDQIDVVRAEILLKEANEISIEFDKQQKDNNFTYKLPELKLQKPIKKLTWANVGESLIHMHNYMFENCYTHASKLQLIYQQEVETMDISVNERNPNEHNPEENMEIDKVYNEKEDNSNEKESPDKLTLIINENNAESDQENTPTNAENKDQKKTQIRRRGSALSFLEQWEWCTKRRSSRKKPQTKQDRADENIYETLRRLIPITLTPEVAQKKQDKSERLDDSPDTMDLYRMFEEKQATEDNEDVIVDNANYFGLSAEEIDVRNFVEKYTDGKYDIIDILREYLITLAVKWNCKWPSELLNIFVEASKCCSSHLDTPNFSDENHEDTRFFVLVNLIMEEIIVNKKLCDKSDNKGVHDLAVIEAIGILISQPHIFNDCMEITLRYLWLKYHCYLYINNDELALDCLSHLIYEFEAMDEHQDTYILNNSNFTFKPVMSKLEVTNMMTFMERNKRLSTVMGLYDEGNFEDVLKIITDSFEHCKTTARKQEYDAMSLDFAVQLSVILDCYWELRKPNECFKWSMICLHESLKHYLLCSSGTQEHEKWSLAVVKALACIEHCLKIEGTIILDLLSEKELNQAIENVIQIIGHQVDESNGVDMPLNSVSPWIILHYILQREEDQGRFQRPAEGEKSAIANDDIPNALMVLFVGHEHIGAKGWCMNSEGQLLYFILDNVVPRLRTPSLSKCVELVCQHLEQCVFCLFGHPSKKTKLRYLIDHNVMSHKLDWERSQQVFEIFKPSELPEIEGKLPSITAETEQLYQRIISVIPNENEPQKHLPQIIKYIELNTDEIPSIPNLLPFKMKDLYFLLGDYYFKKDERSKSMKYNLYDILINNDRFESWAEIALAKATNMEVKLNSSADIKDLDYINEASTAIRCFKRALELDSMHCNLWIEYGVFVYGIHSFCSRLLKQASESLSMEEFELLENRKEDMLDTAHKCFTTVSQDLNSSDVQEDENDEFWLHFYMLGKVAEKKNKPPKEYLGHYMQAAKHLEDNNATYPTKINYNSPQHLSIEALEVQYRIHASVLKYCEQHENKVILMSDGKVFQEFLEKCANGPFSTKKKTKKDNADETEINTTKEPEPANIKSPQPPQPGVLFKRSISDSGEDAVSEAKKQKTEAAAKVRRAASYDADCQAIKDSLDPQDSAMDVLFKAAMIHSQDVKITEPEIEKPKEEIASKAEQSSTLQEVALEPSAENATMKDNSENNKDITTGTEVSKPNAKKNENSNSDSSSSSSPDSSSDDSSSDSSSSSSDTDSTTKSVNDAKPMTEADIMNVISTCLNALEDCVSRFPQHYKALYRLAHYHFYYKKGKDIERCRDLMMGNFMSRNNQKLPGLFCERKNNNFFNAIWRIPATEVDRAGSFACHMSRCVLLSMEILKEIDDHKSLLDLNMQLSKIPEPDKKYLRDSEREELAQQAFSLCVQSLKGQLTKFSQQPDLKTNEMERQALNSLMLDIYRAYQKVQKQPLFAKQFTNLLVEAFKLISAPFHENVNLVDLSMRHCQSLIAALKQQATMASLSNAKKNTSKSFEILKSQQPHMPQTLAKVEPPKISHSAPMMSPQEISAAFKSYLPMLNDNLLSQQTAAAVSLLNVGSSLAAAYPLQTSLPQMNSFQNEYYNKLLTSLSSGYVLPKNYNHPKKNTTYNRTGNTMSKVQKPKNVSKSITGPLPSTFNTSDPKTFVSNVPMSTFALKTNTTPSAITNIPSSFISTVTQASNATITSVAKPKPSSVVTSIPSSSINTVVPLKASNTTISSVSKPKPSAVVTSIPSSSINTVVPLKVSNTTITSVSKPKPSSMVTSIPSSSINTVVPLNSSNTTITSVSKPKPSTVVASILSSSINTVVPLKASNTTITSVSKPKPSTVVTTISSSYMNAVAPLHASNAAITAVAKPKPAQSPTLFSISQILTPMSAPSVTQMSAPCISSISSFGTTVQPAHMSSMSSSYTPTSTGTVKPAHMTTTSTVNDAIHMKPPLPHQQVSPGKTLQEKLAERQKSHPVNTISNVSVQEIITSSINKLSSSLTVTKTNVSSTLETRQIIQEAPRKPEPKQLQFNNVTSAPKSTSSSDVIILDDDS